MQFNPNHIAKQLRPAGKHIELESISESQVVNILISTKPIDDFIREVQTKVADDLLHFHLHVVKANVTNVALCPITNDGKRVLVTVTVTPVVMEM